MSYVLPKKDFMNTKYSSKFFIFQSQGLANAQAQH